MLFTRSSSGAADAAQAVPCTAVSSSTRQRKRAGSKPMSPFASWTGANPSHRSARRTSALPCSPFALVPPPAFAGDPTWRDWMASEPCAVGPPRSAAFGRGWTIATIKAAVRIVQATAALQISWLAPVG